MKKVLILSSEQGKNLDLANKVFSQFQLKGIQADLVDLVALELPLFTVNRLKDEGVPNAALAFVDLVKACDGFVFVAPEYNGGVPPVLVNVLSWITVSTKDWRQCFNTKIAGIGTYSGSGGMQLITSLRGQLSYLGLTVIGLPLHTNQTKGLLDDDLNSFVNQISTLL